MKYDVHSFGLKRSLLLGLSRRGDELRLNTSGIIHLRRRRAVQFGARGHASADPCQNSLQEGSCIIFFGCPGSKWTSSLSVSLSVKNPLTPACIMGIPFCKLRTQASPDHRVGSLPTLRFLSSRRLSFCPYYDNS